jgi:hypothetical protein
MRKLGAAFIAVVVALALALPVLADHGDLTEQGNCPEAGKVEANAENQEAINDLVLDAGTHVCIKGAQKTALVTADGESTLMELLDSRNANDNLQDVSHYSVIENDTTTTTQPDDDETTTTTEQESTTTEQGETTYDCIDGEIVELNPGDEGYPGVAVDPSVFDCTVEATVTTVQATISPTLVALPFTGLADWLIPAAVAAVAMLGLGGVLAWIFRDRLS